MRQYMGIMQLVGLTHSGSVSKDSPDDNKNDNVSPRACGNSGDHDVANPTLLPVTAPATPYASCARLFNMQISATATTTAAWVGLQWVGDPTHAPSGNTTYNCTIAPYNHSAAAHWHGTNTGYASAVALSSGPTVIRDQPPTSSVWTRGVFTWGKNNATNIGTIPTYPSSCSSGATLVCRPAQLTPFPTFQQFLGLDDDSFQNLLDNPDTTKADINAGRPPLGFTYIQGDFTFNNATASPGMVHGSTQITAGTGNMKLLYSRRAAELGIQASHPWRILSWEDTAMGQ